MSWVKHCKAQDNHVYMTNGQCTFQLQKYVLGETLQAQDNQVYMSNGQQCEVQVMVAT